MQWRTFDFKAQRSGKKGQLLKKYIYTCGFCSGKGFTPSRKRSKCPTCVGTGSVRIHPPSVICAYCNGSGKSHINSDLTCNVCGGGGVVSVGSDQIEICPTCKGRGRERGASLPCLTCKGIGVVTKK